VIQVGIWCVTMTIDQTPKLMAMTKMFFIKEIIGLSYFFAANGS
jgi:hypothetical protein